MTPKREGRAAVVLRHGRQFSASPLFAARPTHSKIQVSLHAVCVVDGRNQFACIGYGEVYPLWALSTVARGGLDWTTKQIGQVRFGVDKKRFVYCFRRVVIRF